MSNNFNTNINKTKNLKRRNSQNGGEINRIISKDNPHEIMFPPVNNPVQPNFNQNISLPSQFSNINHAYKNNIPPQLSNFNPVLQNENQDTLFLSVRSLQPNSFYYQQANPCLNTPPPFFQPPFNNNINSFPQNPPVYSSFPAPPFPLHPHESLAPSINVSVPPPNFVDKNSIQYWNNKWIQKVSQIKAPIGKQISISDYKEKVAVLSSQIKELEKLTTHLQILSKSLTDEDWNVRKSEIEKQKADVQKTIDDLKLIPLPEIKDQLKRRLSKRKRLKRKREEYKEIKKENKAICQLEHSRIDAWLDKMKDQVERTRREEDIKKQADFVLSEVFHKKAEAKRMLSLLTTLGKLRNARIHDRESKGEFVSREAAEAFNSIIENLKKRWIDQINGYNLEEQGLRVMLDDAETKRSSVEISLNKQIYQHWLRVIFGEQHRDNILQPQNLQDLIHVRTQWDHFITTEEITLLGSAVPNGWILPSPPSNNTWATFLKP